MKINPSSWFINNRTTMYLITAMLCLLGYSTYNKLAKEQFPEIKIAQIIVQTINPGTSPENMENLVSKPIEKQLKNITGVKKVTSNSFQDYSIVIAEFNADVKIEKAKQEVKDAVDKAKPDLPQNLPYQPEVRDIDLSEVPIMYINIAGDFDLARLKKYAERIEEKVEALKEIRRVDVLGAPEREIRVEVDLPRMQSAQLSFFDIYNTVSSENIESTPGQVVVDGEQRNIAIKKTFKTMDEIRKLVVKSPTGASIYLEDIATIKDTFKDADNFARLNGKNAITLNVIKRSGENLISASDKIEALLKEMKGTDLPKSLSIQVTGDQSVQTRTTLHDLINTIIIGFVLVTVILMFFMGTTNALFVAMSVPISCAIAFIVFPAIGFSLNMIVLFAFLLALGIVVDDAIVVIENAHRIFHEEDLPIKEAVKKATSEVFLPVLTGTITTMMPFMPLAFWNSIIGKFMFFLPVTLMITLFASLLVAYFINPVFAVDFMKKDHATNEHPKWEKSTTRTAIIMLVLALLSYASKNIGLGNFVVFLFLMILANKFYFVKWIAAFQQRVWPRIVKTYVGTLQWALHHRGLTLGITGGIFVLAIVLLGVRQPKVVFFPQSEPNFAYVYLNMREGTDQSKTNQLLLHLEEKVNAVIKTDYAKDLVASVISNVKKSATDSRGTEIGDFPNKGKITIAFTPFEKRKGKSTQKVLDDIRKAVNDIPGAQITVDKDQGGPPTAKAILLEITGDDLQVLDKTAKNLITFIKKQKIDGIEELRSDFQSNKPEINLVIDRERLAREGINSAQISNTLRTALFGLEVSRYKDANDDYPINLRLDKDNRNNIDYVKNISFTYRDMAMGGQIRQVPLSNFVTLEYNNTFGSIKRKNEKRIITVSSNVLGGYNANAVVAEISKSITDFPTPNGVNIRIGGEQEEQAETMGFLGGAFGIAFALITILLFIQFNSYSRVVVIISEIFMSIIGVLLGVAIFGNEVSIVMSGIGIVALAGIVVRNGILLIEFFDVKLKEGYQVYDALVDSGRTRMTPVLLTATAAILGLIPLAVGLNIDFAGLFTSFRPNIFIGGDSVAFWGPLSWTMIYGLGFATILTLIVVPVLMSLAMELKLKINPNAKLIK